MMKSIVLSIDAEKEYWNTGISWIYMVFSVLFWLICC